MRPADGVFAVDQAAEFCKELGELRCAARPDLRKGVGRIKRSAIIRALTTRAWAFAELSNRHTLQQRDLLAAIMSDDMYDFLIDVTSDAILAMQKKQKAAAEAAAAL